jgi:hypothetical protein
MVGDMTAADLFASAKKSVLDTRRQVNAAARISHVGFRSRSLAEWEQLKKTLVEYGELFMTFKADGRQIPFVKLARPLEIGADILEYIEIPAPKPVQVDEPGIVVVYQSQGIAEAKLVDGYDIRQQAKHAADFIERDKKRD